MNGIRLSIILCSVFFFPFRPDYCKTIEVKKSGAVNSIKQALNLAGKGDTVLVRTGFYSEGTIIIDKEIALLGRGKPIVSGNKESEIITVKSSNVVISGFIFKDCGVSFIEDNAAVKLDSVSNCRIINNEFENNFFGIYLAQSSSCSIINNKINSSFATESMSGNGIHLWYCKDITVEGNAIEGHRDGIYLEFVQSSSMNNNTAANNLRYGLHFMFSDNCTYSKNRFAKNGAGVAVMYTKNIDMTENVFELNWGSSSYGMLLKDISDSRVTRNKFEKNSSGIYIEGCNRVVIERNEFVENGWAVRLMANSMDNTITKNNFIGNSFDVSTNNTKNYNTFDYNYWSEYKGYDIDYNGVGDIPHRPIKLFSVIVERNRPAMILLRSFFASILDVAERIFPVLTPETLFDARPSMHPFGT